jgi:hypothetical protein
MPPRVADSLDIPTLPWSVIKSRLAQMWDVRDAPHHSVIGQTRSGKSYLTRHGILDVCKNDRVLFIDAKGDDPTLEGLGKVVHRFPNRLRRATAHNERPFLSDTSSANAQRKRRPMQDWFRLVTSPQWEIATQQVEEALDAVYQDGDWIVVVDETRYVTDARVPGLGLRGLWEQINFRGGSRGVGMVSLTQEPRWVPGSFYTQSSFYWFSRVEDELAQKRIGEVGSSRELLPYLKTIPRRWWVYTDNLEDERFWALTTVPARG